MPDRAASGWSGAAPQEPAGRWQPERRPDGPSFVYLSSCTVGLAWRDLIHEWRIALCLTLALASVLTPILILFGLKSGIVTTLTERLKSDPRNLELLWKHNAPLETAWIETLRSRPEVGFLVPNTRTLAAMADFISDEQRLLTDINMIPTAPGDPLFSTGTPIPQGLREVALTHGAAQKLGIARGAFLAGVVRRNYRGEAHVLRFPLRVVGVLSEANYSTKAAFVSLPLLLATENYRDGYEVAELGVFEGKGEAPRQRRFARLRLYGRSLDEVAALADHLRSAGFDIETHAKDIEMVRSIDRTLSFLFRMIAGVGTTGFVLSLATSLWANVERKRRELAMLRLVGLTNNTLAFFPASQSVLIAGGGLGLSALLYFTVSVLINQNFAAELGREEFVCRLFPGDALMAGLFTVFFALFSSVMGGYRAAKIDPAEHLREP